MEGFSHTSDLREKEKVGYEVGLVYARVVDILSISSEILAITSANFVTLVRNNSHHLIGLGNKSRVSIRQRQTPPR